MHYLELPVIYLMYTFAFVLDAFQGSIGAKIKTEKGGLERQGCKNVSILMHIKQNNLCAPITDSLV